MLVHVIVSSAHGICSAPPARRSRRTSKCRSCSLFVALCLDGVVLDVIIDPFAERHDGFPTAAFAEQIAGTLQRLVAERWTRRASVVDRRGRPRMPLNKPHLEFQTLDMNSGWVTPDGYPAGIKQKVLASDLDERRKSGSRTRAVTVRSRAFTPPSRLFMITGRGVHPVG
jgi:hypothetical protein